jgi:exodeoxyribonuclease VII large subunit
MGKPVKSQWDFGELFPEEQIRKVLTVSQLTWQIKRLLEGQVGQVWVTGEITNLRLQNSGHIYFTLKDAGAQVSCVLFRGELQAERSLIQDGRKVLVCGEVTVYEPRGQYQLRVTKAEMQGVGALQVAFEKLKQKLNAEGLFAQERKRPLPKYPHRIGLVTSPTGAAIRDVLHVVERRDPSLELIMVPCRVQGEGAGREIAAAIRLLNEFNQRMERTPNLQATAKPQRLDLILVTRGGGSLEDLWAFNEEIVARAIFDSAVPVVSAVGHEIDFTISDFVADVRAATPSAAAEIITEGVFSSCQFVSEARARLGQLLRQQLEGKRGVLTRTGQRLNRLHPRRRMNDWLQRLDDLQGSMLRCVKQGARQKRLVLRNLSERLARVRPAVLLRQRREVLEQAEQRLREQARHRMREWVNEVRSLDSKLRLLGPEQVLGRGYSITMDGASGAVVRDAGSVKPGQRLKTRLKAGEVKSRVED